MCLDASDSSDSDDDREQARLQLLKKKKRHRMDDRARSIREQEPKRLGAQILMHRINHRLARADFFTSATEIDSCLSHCSHCNRLVNRESQSSRLRNVLGRRQGPIRHCQKPLVWINSNNTISTPENS